MSGYVWLEEITDVEIDESLPRVEITEDGFNVNSYETYYWTKDANYFY